MNIMILAFLLPAMRAQRWKRWGSALCMACALFVLPTLFNSGAYYTIYADVVLGCVFFHALYAWFFTPRDRGGVLLTGGSLFLLPLIKEAGWGLCLIALAIMAVDLIGERNRSGLRRVRDAGCLAAAALTSALAARVLELGRVPFYCCAWSNVPSARNAVRSGFRPAWVQLTAKPEPFVRAMNEKTV